jgi:hypothetical protein
MAFEFYSPAIRQGLTELARLSPGFGKHADLAAEQLEEGLGEQFITEILAEKYNFHFEEVVRKLIEADNKDPGRKTEAIKEVIGVLHQGKVEISQLVKPSN